MCVCVPVCVCKEDLVCALASESGVLGRNELYTYRSWQTNPINDEEAELPSHPRTNIAAMEFKF